MTAHALPRLHLAKSGSKHASGNEPDGGGEDAALYLRNRTRAAIRAFCRSSSKANTLAEWMRHLSNPPAEFTRLVKPQRSRQL